MQNILLLAGSWRITGHIKNLRKESFLHFHFLIFRFLTVSGEGKHIKMRTKTSKQTNKKKITKGEPAAWGRRSTQDGFCRRFFRRGIPGAVSSDGAVPHTHAPHTHRAPRVQKRWRPTRAGSAAAGAGTGSAPRHHPRPSGRCSAGALPLAARRDGPKPSFGKGRARCNPRCPVPRARRGRSRRRRPRDGPARAPPVPAPRGRVRPPPARGPALDARCYLPRTGQEPRAAVGPGAPRDADLGAEQPGPRSSATPGSQDRFPPPRLAGAGPGPALPAPLGRPGVLGAGRPGRRRASGAAGARRGQGTI